MKTPGIKTVYKERAIPGMKKELGIKSPMALPRVSKVVVNVGIGQKVVMTKAKKAIAGFKIREGLEVGARVTLHGERMWDFLDRFFNVALPRVRDFKGLSKNVIDQGGNANIGIKEHAVFPEIVPEKVQHLFSFQVNIVTTAKNKQEGEALFRLIGLPLQGEEPKQ